MADSRVPALSVRMRLTLWYSAVLIISLVSFAAVVYTTLARTLELKGMDSDPARDEAAIAALEGEYQRAAAALKDLRNG